MRKAISFRCKRRALFRRMGVAKDRAASIISRIGSKAGVITNADARKSASAQDYRRSFGTRWAQRVMPAVLKRLMRHKVIETTLRYCVDRDVEDIAADLWAAYVREEPSVSKNANSHPGTAPKPR